MYLIIEKNAVVHICETPESLLEHLKVTVSDKGIVTFGEGKQLTISYKMDEFTKSEVETDIMQHQLKQIQAILKIAIFKMTRI